ncbi:hypothetical protein BDQ17DRAFT_1332673 [Cyathus striatus]|nr:hypothetical protein BDQ17DRAFT_1332673 [Cyathus striatus]
MILPRLLVLILDSFLPQAIPISSICSKDQRGNDYPATAAQTSENAAIGNLSKKADVARDEAFVRTVWGVDWNGRLVQCLNPPHVPRPEVGIEAAHVLASLAYGINDSLISLLPARIHQALLYALAHIQPMDPQALAVALARARRAIMSAAADIDILDILLPHLHTSNTQLHTRILHLFPSTTRSATQCTALSSWTPPSEHANEVWSRREREIAPLGPGWVVRELIGIIRSCITSLLAAICRDLLGVLSGLIKPDREGYVPLERKEGWGELAGCLWRLKIHGFITFHPASESEIQNLMWMCEVEVRREVMRLLTDSDTAIQEEEFNILHNLASDEGVDLVFEEVGTDVVLDQITAVLGVVMMMLFYSRVETGSTKVCGGMCRRACGEIDREDKRRMVDAGTLRLLCEWSVAGVAAPSSPTATSPLRSSVVGRRNSSVVRSVSGSMGVGVVEAVHQWGIGIVSGHGHDVGVHGHHSAMEDDRDVVGTARRALEWLEHGDSYSFQMGGCWVQFPCRYVVDMPTWCYIQKLSFMIIWDMTARWWHTGGPSVLSSKIYYTGSKKILGTHKILAQANPV